MKDGNKTGPVDFFRNMTGTSTDHKWHQWRKHFFLTRMYDNRTRYTAVIVTQKTDGTMRQFSIHENLLTPIIIINLILIAVLATVSVISIKRGDALNNSREQLLARVSSLEEVNDLYIHEKESLTSQVEVLSDTVKQKTQAEMDLAAREEEAALPKGLPVDGLGAMGDLPETADEEKISNFQVSKGSCVVASGAGKVIAVETDSQYGNRVIVDHGNGYRSVYRCHGAAKVKENQEVRRGWILFLIDEDDTKLGYQILMDDEYVDPMQVIEISG